MTIQSVDLPLLNPKPGTAPAAPVTRLAAIAGVRAELTVVAGRASSKVGDLLSLKEGEVLALDQPLDSHFEVMLGEHVIARGELVAVGDVFGIRIVEVAPREAAA